MNRIVTIGVIGFDASGFFRALQEAGVHTLVDIRRRRAVRGHDYAFANSQRLQTRLAELGIGYVHRLDLAPTESMRTAQSAADQAAHVPRRQRQTLSPVFIEAFEREVLGHFDPQAFAAAMPPGEATIALLCVEREPAACHRALVAARLGQALGLPVSHIVP